MKSNLAKNNKGAAAIEMAIVLPILILIIAAVIEFGLYFLKSQAASRAVSTASISLQQNYTDGTIKTTMQKNGLGMMNLAASPNFVCAKAYATADAADTGSCTAPDWQINAPSGVTAGTPYYIAVRAFAVHTPLTPLRAISGVFPPDIDSRNIVAINNSSGWVDVPLTDTKPYDVNCEYRFRLKRPVVSGLWAYGEPTPQSNNYYYATYVSNNVITSAPTPPNTVQEIPSATKNKLFQCWTFDACYDWSANNPVNNIQKRCQ